MEPKRDDTAPECEEQEDEVRLDCNGFDMDDDYYEREYKLDPYEGWDGYDYDDGCFPWS